MSRYSCKSAFLLAAVLVVAACARPGENEDRHGTPDPHSFSRPDQIVVEHLELDLTVDFEARKMRGRATLHFDNRAGVRELTLDSRDLDIQRVLLGPEETETSFRLGDEVEFLGRSSVSRVCSPSVSFACVEMLTLSVLGACSVSLVSLV